MQAVMYNRKKPVAKVEMEHGKVTKIVSVLNREYVPVLLQKGFDTDSLNNWIEKRRLPHDREGFPEVSGRFRYFEKYPESDSPNCMFSLTDQYWFQFDSSQTWENGNYFLNPYSEDIGKAFFTPWAFPADHAFRESPDLTTNGLLCKRWTRDADGTSYMIKAGSRALRQEPISEVLASIMLRKLKILPYVEYELVVEGMRLCSKCRNFVTENTEFVPASHIYLQGKRYQNETIYQCLLRMCKKFRIEGARDYIDKMIVVDHLLGNEDRHLGNFGFIRNVETLEITGFAPLFDSGYSFVPGNRAPKANEKKRVYFTKEDKKRALRRSLRLVDMEKLEDHDEMFDLIDVYPEIDEEERRYIKDQIINAPDNALVILKDHDRVEAMART